MVFICFYGSIFGVRERRSLAFSAPRVLAHDFVMTISRRLAAVKFASDELREHN